MEKEIIYPRTHHLPWSGYLESDDRTIENDNIFKDKLIVMSEKLDGANFTIYRDRFQVRNVSADDYETNKQITNYISSFQNKIPEGYRVCGENLLNKHKISYDSSKLPFYGFSIWDDNNYCLSWDDTLKYFNLFGITSSPVLYYDIYDYSIVREIENSLDFDKMEGYVIRLADKFHYDDFGDSIAKFVRKNHESR